MLLFFIFMGTGCDWMYVTPVKYNIDLYKTKGDYRHLYTIDMEGDKISAISCWTRDKVLWSGLNKDTIYKRRQKVANGYVIGRYRPTHVYLSLTYKPFPYI